MAKLPVPGLRERAGRWSIFWRAGEKIREISVGKLEGSDAPHQAETRRCEVELALRTGEWPAWASRKAAVRRLSQETASTGSASDTELLAQYADHCRANSSPRWAGQSIRTLKKSGLPLASLAPKIAQKYLDGLAADKSIATRNRALAIFSRFYKWAANHGGPPNPFAGVRSLKERDTGEEIIHLSRQERDRVLKAADKLPDGLAVWLAIYAGLRRQEIWLAEKSHYQPQAGKLLVPKAKKGIRRTVPVAKALASRLARRDVQNGRIVPWPPGYWPMCDAERACIEALRADKRCKRIPAERISWSAFRHTFGSLLAQSGVGLDKISSWMGNTPAVCKKHYAQFVPRDHRDEEIDLLK
jgi:integrase